MTNFARKNWLGHAGSTSVRKGSLQCCLLQGLEIHRQQERRAAMCKDSRDYCVWMLLNSAKYHGEYVWHNEWFSRLVCLRSDQRCHVSQQIQMHQSITLLHALLWVTLRWLAFCQQRWARVLGGEGPALLRPSVWLVWNYFPEFSWGSDTSEGIGAFRIERRFGARLTFSITRIR